MQYYRFLMFAVLALTGCAPKEPSHPGNPPASNTPRESPSTDGAEAQGTPSQVLNSQLPAEAAVSPVTNPTSRSRPPIAVEPPWPGLVLPSDAAWVKTALPASGAPLPSFRETSRITVGKGYLTQIELLGSGHIIVLSDDEATVRVYDRTTKRLLGNHAVPGFVRFQTGAILGWPGAMHSFLAASQAGLFLIDAQSGKVEYTLDNQPLRALRWSPDGRILMALGDGQVEQTSALSFYERTDGSRLTKLASVAFNERVDGFDLSRDNRLLALVHYPSNTVRVLDIARNGAEVLRVQAPRYAGACAFSPDGRFLATGGEGLLVVDLLNPARRGFYSYVKNNIGFVRFTPSGDAVLASSYDGRIRALRIEAQDSKRLELKLLNELRHNGTANVYGFVFTPDGTSLISASGDQTLRTFTGKPGSSPPTGAATAPVFHDLGEWAKLDRTATQPWAPPRESVGDDGRYVAPAFLAPPRPSRIPPGHYACKITLLYKLRDCWVEADSAGRIVLTFAPDNLLSLRGVLYDDGEVVRYEAMLQGGEGSVVACAGCERQPLQGIFRGRGKRYEGLLTFRTIFDPHSPPPLPAADAKIEEASDRFPVVLEYKGPLREATSEARKP